MKSFKQIALAVGLVAGLSVGVRADWVQTNGPWLGYSIHTITVNGNNVFAGTDGAVFHSANNGASWTAIKTGLNNVNAIVISGTGDIIAGTDSGIFVIANNGTSWATVNTGLTNTSVYSLAIIGTGDIFAGTGDGIFLSTNKGTSWTAVNYGIRSTSIYSLVVGDNSIFAGTGYGVWRRPLSEMVGITPPEMKKRPQKLSSLEIIASGRSNSRVMVGFSLGRQEKISVKVYNLSGMEVASLVDGGSRSRGASGGLGHKERAGGVLYDKNEYSGKKGIGGKITVE